MYGYVAAKIRTEAISSRQIEAEVTKDKIFMVKFLTDKLNKPHEIFHQIKENSNKEPLQYWVAFGW